MEHLLPPRLGALLALEPDRLFSDRLRRVHQSAARAIHALGDLDLVKFEEESPIEGSADLSMWEELAPVLSETLANVNALLVEMRQCFPEGELVLEPRQGEVTGVVHGSAAHLTAQVQAFGEHVRDPQVVSDRWNLITELQSFRNRFREAIGAMVFDTAQVLGDCQRREVEPGFPEALAQTLLVRSTTAQLRRLMHARLVTVAEAEAEDVLWNVQQLRKELDSFGRTPAWKALRAQDKRAILEFRRSITAVDRDGVRKVELVQVLEPFVEFVDGFEAINQREVLLQHDREVSARVGVLLESATSIADHAQALMALEEAIEGAQPLAGRSPELDTFLRRLKKEPPAEEALQPVFEQFLQLIAGLALY